MIIPVMPFHLVLVTCSVLVITNQNHKNFISEVNHHLSSAFPHTKHYTIYKELEMIKKNIYKIWYVVTTKFLLKI